VKKALIGSIYYLYHDLEPSKAEMRKVEKALMRFMNMHQ
jgi:hypothetical protein